MSFELDTIKVKAEIQEERETKIKTFCDLTSRYSQLGSKDKEHLYAVFLDNGNNLIGDKLISLGGQFSVQVDLQDILRTALLVKAAAVLVVHNHPSGNPRPTQPDLETTEEIHDSLATVDVELLDHAIISRNQSHSMRENHDGPF